MKISNFLLRIQWSVLLLVCVSFGAVSSFAYDDLEDEPEAFKTWDAYLKAHRYDCPGPLDTLDPPRELNIGGKRYLHRGYKLEVITPDADRKVIIGAFGASKDVSKGTKANMQEMADWFRAEGVEWVVANGDLALSEFDLEQVYEVLASFQLPTLVMLGNSDSQGSWARLYRERADKYPFIIDGSNIRQIAADDVEFWTMPGYHNRRFSHQTGVCIYKKEDVDTMRRKLRPHGDAPIMLVSHGPPQGDGPNSIDVIPNGKNVGDSELTRLIKRRRLPLGLFSHILEAGGRAVTEDFKTPIRENTWSKSMHINVGSLSGDPWGMLDGTSSFGMAAIIEIGPDGARYKFKRSKSRF